MKRTLLPILILALAATGSAQFPPQAQTALTTGPKLSGYLFFDYSKGEADSPFPEGRIGGLGAGFFLTGQLSVEFGYDLEVRYAGANRVELDQAWLSWNASDAIKVLVGEYLVPFGRYNQNSRPHETLFVNVPLVFEFAYPERWRDLGAQGRVAWSWLNLTAYVGNGLREAAFVAEGQQFGDNNAAKAWGGRLGLKPDPTIELGVSYTQDKYDDPGSRSLKLLGADAAWITRDYQVLGEYVRTTSQNPAPFGKGVVEGFYVLVAIDYQSFYPMVSYQQVRASDPFHGTGWEDPDVPGEGIAVNKTRWAAGLVYQPVNILRLKLEYDFNKDKGLSLRENLFSVQAAVSF
jgi:hypothetical protein